MSESGKKKLSTEPYKGVRDFYPEDMFVQNYLFEAMRRVCESFGYQEYNASILEPTELYLDKTSEEIVNEQTYTFEDRGGRSVTLRPEMTPSVARMVAARRRELGFPVRWFTIGNMFRYERPQRGRVREHWQLNADVFGVENSLAEIEIITMVHALLTEFGATESDFSIRIGDRALTELMLAEAGVEASAHHEALHLIDRRAKMEPSTFREALAPLIPDAAKLDSLLSLLDINDLASLPPSLVESAPTIALVEILAALESAGIGNARFDASLVRGFDYYTGAVFEVFDTNPENPRSLFGGGRYDHLLESYGSEPTPAVGFGMGDVTLRDFLATRDLIPAYTPSATVFLCTVSPADIPAAQILAKRLRQSDIPTAVNFLERKVGDQFKAADKMRIPFVIAVGEEETKTDRYTIKNLATGAEASMAESELADFLWAQDA